MKKMDPKTLIGLTEKQAEAKIKRWGMTMRILREDREIFYGTCEHNRHRINLEIDDGRVTKATIG